MNIFFSKMPTPVPRAQAQVWKGSNLTCPFFNKLASAREELGLGDCHYAP